MVPANLAQLYGHNLWELAQMWLTANIDFWTKEAKDIPISNRHILFYNMLNYLLTNIYFQVGMTNFNHWYPEDRDIEYIWWAVWPLWK